MNIGQFLMMRHELLLTAAALIILIAEIATADSAKRKLIPFSVILFALVTLAGFLPVPEGTLFGGSYQSNPLTSLMKNVLNIPSAMMGP